MEELHIPDDFKVPIFISEGALLEGIDFVRAQKEQAIDREDFEQAQDWRDSEKQLISALGGRGLLAADAESAA